MLIHHTGKDVGRGARGHSSLWAAIDTGIEVSEHKISGGNNSNDKKIHDNDPPEVMENCSPVAGRAFMIKVTKQRDLPVGEELCFRLYQVNLGVNARQKTVTNAIVMPLAMKEDNSSEKNQPLNGQAREAFDVLQALIDENGIEMPDVNDAQKTVAAVKKVDWKDKLYSIPKPIQKNGSAKSRGFYRSVGMRIPTRSGHPFRFDSGH